MLLDSDWIRLSNLLREDWIDHLTASLALIGSTQRDSARLSGQANNPVNVEEVFKKTVKWLSATTNGIDNEDAKIVGRVSSLCSMYLLEDASETSRKLFDLGKIEASKHKFVLAIVFVVAIVAFISLWIA